MQTLHQKSQSLYSFIMYTYTVWLISGPFIRKDSEGSLTDQRWWKSTALDTIPVTPLFATILSHTTSWANGKSAAPPNLVTIKCLLVLYLLYNPKSEQTTHFTLFTLPRRILLYVALCFFSSFPHNLIAETLWGIYIQTYVNHLALASLVEFCPFMFRWWDQIKYK